MATILVYSISGNGATQPEWGEQGHSKLLFTRVGPHQAKMETSVWSGRVVSGFILISYTWFYG